MTKELGAVAGTLRKRKSILKFKQSPPQGKHAASLSQPVPLISNIHESSGSRNRNVPHLKGLEFVFLFFVTHPGSSWHAVSPGGEAARASTSPHGLLGRTEKKGWAGLGPQLGQPCLDGRVQGGGLGAELEEGRGSEVLGCAQS